MQHFQQQQQGKIPSYSFFELSTPTPTPTPVDLIRQQNAATLVERLAALNIGYNFNGNDNVSRESNERKLLNNGNSSSHILSSSGVNLVNSRISTMPPSSLYSRSNGILRNAYPGRSCQNLNRSDDYKRVDRAKCLSSTRPAASSPLTASLYLNKINHGCAMAVRGSGSVRSMQKENDPLNVPRHIAPPANSKVNSSDARNSTPTSTNLLEERFSRKVFVGGLPPDIDEAPVSDMTTYDSTHLSYGSSVWPMNNNCYRPQQLEFQNAPYMPRAILKTNQSFSSGGGSLNSSPLKSASATSSFSMNSSKQSSPLRPFSCSSTYQPSLYVDQQASFSPNEFTFQQPSQNSIRQTQQSSRYYVSSVLNEEKFSRKVFVGGLPMDITEDEINATFSQFGACYADWPHKAETKSYFPPKGYAFLIFENEASVQALIGQCLADGGKYYLYVSSPTTKAKQVQLRPWLLKDADFFADDSLQLDPRKMIFVGGVPRPLKASELALIMNRLYGGVIYASIDTDPELKYPKGAGRVAFSNQQSYIAAISGRFVQLQYDDIPDKRAEIKPYVLDDQICDECQGAACNGKYAPFFCANVSCLQYYCDRCWVKLHSGQGRENHKPLVKEGSDRPRVVDFKWP